MVAEYVGLRDQIAWADVVVTGEGRLDPTSFEGKVVGGVVSARPRCGPPGSWSSPVSCAAGFTPTAPKVVALAERVGHERALADPSAGVEQVVREELSR